jgi:transcriptional regulator with XRE-family HTH domain
MTPLQLQIRTLRDQQGLTQAELAAAAGVSRATINRIETGRSRTVDLDMLEKVARALGVAPQLLLADQPRRRR